MYAFVDGAVDVNRRRDQGGATFGSAGVVLVQRDAEDITSYRIIGVPFWPHSLFITNNTMEVMAAKIACDVGADYKNDFHIWSDSQYVKNMLSFGSGYTAQKNCDLIEYARRSVARDRILVHYCPGHTGFVWNELADLAARKAVELRKGFDKTYVCRISLLCFRCSKFPCDTGMRGFGTEHAALKEPLAYGGLLECDQFEMIDVEGF